MIIDEDSDSDAPPSRAQVQVRKGEEVEGTAYKDSMISVDGFSKTPSGRVKFNKDTKKRRRVEMEDGDAAMDVDMADATVGDKSSKKKAKDIKLGSEFKAKVRCCFEVVEQTN